MAVTPFRTITIRVGLQPKSGQVDDRPRARIPDFLPRRGWQIDRWGYLFYSSRSTTTGIRRGSKCHRVVMARLGLVLDQDIQVHHQDNNKLNCCPCNLIAMPGSFNPSGAKRDPYTGEFMSIDHYRRRYSDIYAAVIPVSISTEVPF